MKFLNTFHGIVGACVPVMVALVGCGGAGGEAVVGTGTSTATTPITTTVAVPTAGQSPNILFILADDLGYSDLAAFGGEISTPNLDLLVQNGHMLKNHHSGSVCAVTRSMLISGTDHHLVGQGTMGAPSAEQLGLPGYEGYLNDRALSVAQLLKDGGYHTYMAGKWHLGAGLAGSGAGGKSPDQWGFERSYAMLGGAATNHFAHEAAGSKNYAEDGAYVQPGQPGQPGGTGGGTFYSTDFFTQKLIAQIESKRIDGKPFFAYAAYTAPHWPLQVPEPWLSKYAGKYDAGYEVVRNARVARQKALGLIPADFTPYAGAVESTTRTAATANNGKAGAKYINALQGPAAGYVDYGQGAVNKKWASLTALEKKSQARYMEIYAGMVENLDYNVGLLITYLKATGQYDNTMIAFQSDNGAEGWPIDNGADPKATDEANASAAVFANLGTDNGATNAKRLQYGLRWAEVSATPFKLTKGYAGEGGVSTPLIVRMPGQYAAAAVKNQLTHITDLPATFLALAGVSAPSTPAPALINAATGVDQNKNKVIYNGRYVYPITGVSLVELLLGKTSQLTRAQPLGDETYGRAFMFTLDGLWKALWTEPPEGPADGHWALYDMTKDRGETNDLAQTNPSMVESLVTAWKKYLSDTGGVEPARPLGYY